MNNHKKDSQRQVRQFGPGMGRGFAGGKAKDFKKSYKMLINYMKPYLPMVISSFIFALIGTILIIIGPKYIGDITTALEIGVKNNNMYDALIKIRNIGIFLIILYLAGSLFQIIQAFIMTKVTQLLSRKLRNEISSKINKLPLKYFDTRTYGDVLSIVTNDVDTISMSLNQALPNIISSLTTIVGAMVMMFLTNRTLFLVSLISIPVSTLVMGLIVKFSQKYFVSQQKNLGNLNGHIEEIYSGHSIIKSFNASGSTMKSFNKSNDALYETAWKSQFFSDLMRPFMLFIGNLSYALIVIIGGIMVLKGNIYIGVIQTFLIYIKRFNRPMMLVAQTASTLQSTAAASERVFEFLGEKEMDDESYKTKVIDNPIGHVEFRDVKFGYDPNKMIIKGFNAEAKPGQKIAIVGPTGAGKTTIVNLLMRFYDINSGDILIDGISIFDMKREDVRKLFGMVLQDTWVFEGTIRENIAYGNEDKSFEEIVKMCSNAHVDHFIRTLPGGYDMILDEESGISGGQKQLLTIARAMVNNAPMLILDEATSNVDTRTEVLIQKAMDQLMKGRTSFVIAHRLSTIKNADLILVMKDGDIIESGNHETLLASNGFYADLYNGQFESLKDE